MPRAAKIKNSYNLNFLKKSIFIIAKEVLFSPGGLVGLSAELHKNYWMDSHQTCMEDTAQNRRQ